MYFIVINPNADRRQSILRLPMLAGLFDEAGLDYEVHITTSAMDGYEKTRKFCASYPDCEGVIGVGGDGIIQEIVAGMADAFPKSHSGGRIPVPLGILPAAMANDIVTTLEGGIEQANAKYRKDPQTAVRNFFDMFIKRQLRTVDLITADGIAFLNVGGVGLDAHISQNTAALKQKYQEYAYYIASFKSIISYKSIPLTIDIEGEKQDGEYTMVTVCNGKYYGGGMHIAPSAKIDDGKITLFVLDGLGRLKTIGALMNVLNDKHERIKKKSYISCDSFKLTLPPTVLNLDGNLYPIDGDIEFKVLPGVLEVFA